MSFLWQYVNSLCRHQSQTHYTPDLHAFAFCLITLKTHYFRHWPWKSALGINCEVWHVSSGGPWWLQSPEQPLSSLEPRASSETELGRIKGWWDQWKSNVSSPSDSIIHSSESVFRIFSMQDSIRWCHDVIGGHREGLFMNFEGILEHRSTWHFTER